MQREREREKGVRGSEGGRETEREREHETVCNVFMVSSHADMSEDEALLFRLFAFQIWTLI